jgi:hypothetical protein
MKRLKHDALQGSPSATKTFLQLAQAAEETESVVAEQQPVSFVIEYSGGPAVDALVALGAATRDAAGTVKLQPWLVDGLRRSLKRPLTRDEEEVVKKGTL